MNIQEVKENICRVCLDDSVVLDWNSPVYGYCDITYKDCFYKYTRLNYSGSETYSQMLCQICLNGLYNVHTFILKALESHKILTDTIASNLQLENSTYLKDVNYSPLKFESILVENFVVEPNLQDNLVYEPSNEEISNKSEESKDENLVNLHNDKFAKPKKKKKIKSSIKNSKNVNKRKSNRNDKNYKSSEYNVKQPLNKLLKKSLKKLKQKLSEQHGISDSPIQKSNITEDDKEMLTDGTENIIKEPKVRKKYKEIKKPRMCSICSKILHNKYAVELHEKTHMDNRERNETCKVCGLKFYDKRNLYSHKRIHKENREKIHKCEFCDKAFYDKGGLNIHRRIHLGQMIPCNLCSKQFYRRIDLDRHMTSHSATTINTETKKRSRYFVRCKHCGKSILSTSFKSHTAAHLNEPLMKCSICCKEFFRRASCVLHIKKVHQKHNEEYNDYIILYTKNRISHLFLEQKAEIQLTDS